MNKETLFHEDDKEQGINADIAAIRDFLQVALDVARKEGELYSEANLAYLIKALE